MPTLLVDPAELADDEVVVGGDAYRHLFRALRLGVGDSLRVVDGEGNARQGTVRSVDREGGQIALGGSAPSFESPRRLELLCAVARPQRVRWMVEKATELGVAAVRFVATRRGVRDLGAGQIESLRRVAAAAVAQCGRAALPELSGLHAWKDVPDLLAATPARALLDLDPEAPTLATLAAGWPAAGPAAVLIGPEGGWSFRERDDLAALDCPVAGLGERALRVETAAVAAAGICLLG